MRKLNALIISKTVVGFERPGNWTRIGRPARLSSNIEVNKVSVRTTAFVSWVSGLCFVVSTFLQCIVSNLSSDVAPDSQTAHEKTTTKNRGLSYVDSCLDIQRVAQTIPSDRLNVQYDPACYQQSMVESKSSLYSITLWTLVVAKAKPQALCFIQWWHGGCIGIKRLILNEIGAWAYDSFGLQFIRTIIRQQVKSLIHDLGRLMRADVDRIAYDGIAIIIERL